MKVAQIKIVILQALKDSHPYMLQETTLFAEVNLRSAEAVTMTEFRTTLQELETNRRILCVRDEDKHLKWKITDNGLARLAELV